MATTMILIKTDLSVAQQRQLLEASGNPKTTLHKIKNFLLGMMGGNRPSKMDIGSAANSSDPVSASKAGTFSAAPANAETISINGVTITFVNGTAGNNQVKRDDSPSNSTLASRLAAAINNSTSDDLAGVVNASASSAVVTVSSNVPGVLGNKILIADSAAGFAWAGAATALSGGTGRLPSLSQFSFAR